MKVLFVSAAFPPMKAGEADHAYHQCLHLAKLGVETHLLTTEANRWTQEVPFTVHPIMRTWSWTDLPRFIRFVKRCSPDRVFLFYIGWVYNEHPMVTFAPTVCKRILPHCRVVTMFAYPQGSVSDRFSPITRAVRRVVAKWASEQDSDYEFGTLLRDSDAVIVMSDGHRQAFASHYAPVDKKTILVPPPPLLNMATGQDEEARMRTRKAFGIEREDFLIAYFGYIYPPKGVETVLRAFHLVARTQPHARLILIGGELGRDNPDRPAFGKEMRDLARQLGCEEKVVWTGQFSTEGDEASRYLFAADAGVFGHDLGVAMNNSSFAALIAHGLPTVATQGAALESPIRPGDNVLLCPPKSPEAMSKTLLSIMEDGDLRSRLRRGTVTLATEWFSWEKATDRIVRALTS